MGNHLFCVRKSITWYSAVFNGYLIIQTKDTGRKDGKVTKRKKKKRKIPSCLLTLLRVTIWISLGFKDPSIYVFTL